MKKTPFYQSDPLHKFEDGTRICKWCGKHFYPSTKSKRDHNIYCSKECYKKAHALQQKMWRHNHQDKMREYRRKYDEKHGRVFTPKNKVKPKETPREVKLTHLKKLSDLRVRIITKELMRLELMSCQFKVKRFKINYNKQRKGQEKFEYRVGYIIDELDKKQLYDEHHIDIDYTYEYLLDDRMLQQ